VLYKSNYLLTYLLTTLHAYAFWSLFQDVNCVSGSEGWTLAHIAAFCGRLDCLQVLVKHHATLDSVDHDGNTPGAYTYNLPYTEST